MNPVVSCHYLVHCQATNIAAFWPVSITALSKTPMCVNKPKLGYYAAINSITVPRSLQYQAVLITQLIVYLEAPTRP